MEPTLALKNIVYLFGGTDARYASSLDVAKAVLPRFNAQSYQIKPVLITPQGKWVVADEYVLPEDSWRIAEGLLTQPGILVDAALDILQTDEPHVVFLGIQGRIAEEGTIQALLTSRGLLFTGTEAQALSLARDRPKVLELLQNEEILTPEFILVKEGIPVHEFKAFADFHGWPVMLSTIENTLTQAGTLIQDEISLTDALQEGSSDTTPRMITTLPAGVAVVCCTLVTDKTTLIALSPIATEKELDSAKKHDVQQMALRVHKLVGADGYGQVDMVVSEAGDITVLGIHALPTLAPEGIFVTSAADYGIALEQLLTLMIENVDRSGSDYVTFTIDPADAEELEG